MTNESQQGLCRSIRLYHGGHRVLRLARYFGTRAEMWTGLQADYDLRLARYEKEKQIERDVEPLAALEPVPA